jgi:hypothetical protein
MSALSREHSVAQRLASSNDQTGMVLKILSEKNCGKGKWD